MNRGPLNDETNCDLLMLMSKFQIVTNRNLYLMDAVV